MLVHPTIEKLHTLRFTGMAAALQEQMEMDITDSLSFLLRKPAGKATVPSTSE